MEPASSTISRLDTFPRSNLNGVRVLAPELRALTGNYLTSLRDAPKETVGTYQRTLREFARWVESRGEFWFRSEDVLQYKEYLQARGFAGASVATYLTALRRLCQYLVDIGIIESNPAEKVSGDKRPVKHSRSPLTSREVEALLGAISQKDERGLRDYAIVTLMIGCGLSEIEIVRADVGDVMTQDGATYLYVQGKGRLAKDQVVQLTASARAAIDEYLAQRERIGPRQALFLSCGNRTRGTRMTTRGIRVRINGYLAQAGIKDGGGRRITPFSLRQTAAMMMARSGASLPEIQKQLRLGSLTTARLYVQHDGRH